MLDYARVPGGRFGQAKDVTPTSELEGIRDHCLIGWNLPRRFGTETVVKGLLLEQLATQPEAQASVIRRNAPLEYAAGDVGSSPVDLDYGVKLVVAEGARICCGHVFGRGGINFREVEFAACGNNARLASRSGGNNHHREFAQRGSLGAAIGSSR